MHNQLRRIYTILFVLMALCIACEWHLKPNDKDVQNDKSFVDRFDKQESLYLTTGDFSALQHMNTEYPSETRTLIEDVLKLGNVDNPDINTKFLSYFQDSTLQAVVQDVNKQYDDMSDIDKKLEKSFKKLSKQVPNFKIPHFYAQIGALDQSVIVGNGRLGISLDKYLGYDYPIYKKYYTDRQRRGMTRDFIIPDCLGFYLLSLYPVKSDMADIPEANVRHMAKIQWIVDRTLGTNYFSELADVQNVNDFMKKHKNFSYDQLLRTDSID